MQAISYQTPNIYYYSASIIDFFANSYQIVQIYHAKSFKMKYATSLLKCLVRNSLHQTLSTYINDNLFFRGCQAYQIWCQSFKFGDLPFRVGLKIEIKLQLFGNISWKSWA